MIILVFFRIEWFREPSNNQDNSNSEIIDKRERVYVYRHHSGISKPEAHWAGRARHIYDSKKHSMRIKLSPLHLSDQGTYSCEITYEEPGRCVVNRCTLLQIGPTKTAPLLYKSY